MCLKLVANTIDNLEREKYYFYEYLLSNLICLRRKLLKIQKIKKKKLNHCQPLINALLESVNILITIITLMLMGKKMKWSFCCTCSDAIIAYHPAQPEYRLLEV